MSPYRTLGGVPKDLERLRAVYWHLAATDTLGKTSAELKALNAAFQKARTAYILALEEYRR